MSNEPPAKQFFPNHSSEAQSKRRLGSRAKLAKRFFEDMYASWELTGEAALARAAFHDPMGYLNVVARLMPQKIEHTVPTDGLSDDRLAELIELGERMVALRQSASSVPAMIDVTPSLDAVDEKTALRLCAEEGGGEPDRSSDAAGGGSTSTTRDAPEIEQPEDPNKLKAPWSPEGSTVRYTQAEIDALAPTRTYVENAAAGETVVDDRTPVTPYSSTHATPHPVGRPFPRADHDVERLNRAALEGGDLRPEAEIDPASLF